MPPPHATETNPSTVAPTALSSEALNRWRLLVESMRKVDGSTLHTGVVSRKQLRTRRLRPSASEIRRWSFLRDIKAEKAGMAHQHGLLLSDGLPRQLTLSYQHAHLETLEQKRWENRMRSRWNRIFFSLCALRVRKDRRDALKDIAALRAAKRDSATAHPSFETPESYPASHPLSWQRSESVDEEVLAAELGLDIATYRMLRQLEEREIVPEDYELLGRLDEVVKPATLTNEDLLRFDTRIYTLPVSSCPDVSLMQYGVDYWRLPLPMELDDSYNHTYDCDGLNFSIDFWRLPIATLEDTTAESSTSDAGDVSLSRCSVDVCGVCLVDFDNGDKLRVLPCGHSFHQECIDHWLLNSSTACPVDKRDLRDCL